MSLPIFYFENASFSDGYAALNEETSKHIVQVLRMKVGERLQLTDGMGNLWVTSIADDHKKRATVKMEKNNFKPPPAQKIAIAISLVKNNSRFEWFLEKATEIGITHIIPLLCDRTEKQHFRYDRMKGILVSAMLQSQQVWLPELQEPLAFTKIMENTDYPQKFIAHCEQDEKTDLRSVIRKDSPSLLLIGPEGDFTPSEINTALDKGFMPVALGDTRLRTETAGIVGATLLKFADK